jgi:hypothetical protein
MAKLRLGSVIVARMIKPLTNMKTPPNHAIRYVLETYRSIQMCCYNVFLFLKSLRGLLFQFSYFHFTLQLILITKEFWLDKIYRNVRHGTYKFESFSLHSLINHICIKQKKGVILNS